MNLRNEILAYLYSGWPDPTELSLIKFAEDKAHDPVSVYQSEVPFMLDDGLVRNAAGTLLITGKGVIGAESEGLASPDEIRRKRRLREDLVLRLKLHQDETRGLTDFDIFTFVRDHGITEVQFWGVSRFLRDQELVHQSGNGPPQLTSSGAIWAERLLTKRNRLLSFAKLEALAPGLRGIKFQQLLGAMLEEEAWKVETSVRSNSEENDVIASRDREYYLIECRWTAEKVDSRSVRDLYGKLENRVEVRGIFVSMSGFTKDAVQQATDYFGKRLILLFGPGDVRRWLKGETEFEELLNDKYHLAILKKNFVFE